MSDKQFVQNNLIRYYFDRIVQGDFKNKYF